MSETTSTAVVLSPKAREIGGELERIFSDSSELARYTAGPLNRKDARAIGDTVAEYPQLNTEYAIAIMAWLASFHGEPIGVWMKELLAQYPTHDIDLVIEYLYEEGFRTRADSTLPDKEGDKEATREYVPQLLELLENYKELKGFETESKVSLEMLVDLVGMLGGLKTINQCYDNIDRIDEMLLENQLKGD